ncbi:MAG: carboxylesterase family protein, partial [Deltaproteobacteria bacterium]|nr:carboxylesterase family protein [Deltaproteobacteria bacterium]
MRTPRNAGVVALTLGVAAAFGSLACGGRPTAIQSPEGPSVVVRTTQGLVRGRRGRRIAVFLGIPYAAPPIGPNRWAPPRPPARFAATFDATRAGPVCPQIERSRGSDPSAPVADDVHVRGAEDCLRLNVWAHAVPSSPSLLRPVMVFVHGGGFQQGSGTDPNYEGSALARNGEVVVVTFNYRLGVLGFFAHESFAAEPGAIGAGNQGILDQIAALRWVRDNIAAFGGDPDRVTLFGESAGGGSVCAVIASPLSRGLVARAIVQSGGGCSAWPTLREGVNGGGSGLARGAEIVRAAGCAPGDDVPRCMRALDAASLVRAGTRGERAPLGVPAYGPVIDGAILPASAAARLRDGAIDVPLLVGSNADESSLFVRRIEIESDDDYRSEIRRMTGDRAESVLSVYPPRSLGEPAETFRRAITETTFVCPAEALARAAAGGAHPAYLYHFAHRPPGPLGRIAGAFHGLELLYLFGTFPARWQPPVEDRGVMHLVQSAWSRFAHSGVPRVEPDWPPYRADAPAMLVIDASPAVARDVTDGRCERLR